MERYIKRIIDIQGKLKSKSLFLFGPRQTGKSSLIANQIQDDVKLSWSLLNARIRRRCQADPGVLRDEIETRGIHDGLVIIDEIQKVPELLDEVHLLIEETDIRFLLTGSSARRLKEQGVNLLGGRAGKMNLHPFVWPEIREFKPTLDRILKHGLLPSVFLSDTPDDVLDAYINVYLQEEIAGEGLVRQLPKFERFLEVAALTNAEEINYSNIASDVMMSRASITEWYGILYDTMIGFAVPPYTKTKKRKAVVTERFYFFDVGLVRFLLGLGDLVDTQTEYGKLFETYIAEELSAYLDYNKRKEKLSYWRTRQSSFEVDFVIGDEVAIETKTTKLVNENKDLRGLRALKEEGIFKKYIVVSRDSISRTTDDGIILLPWSLFLDWLWEGKIIGETSSHCEILPHKSAT